MPRSNPQSAHTLWPGLALAVVLSCTVALIGVSSAAKRPWASAVPALTKLHAGAAFQGTSEVRLSAARGECEGAQFVAPPPVEALTADAGPLVLEGAPPVQPLLYREAFLDLTEASNREGGIGAWPDPLIPEKDRYANEARSAFPASSKGPAPVAVYYEVCVPENATPGAYRGKVTLRARDRAPLEFPVTLKVRRFEIPATSSLPSTFGFSGLTAALGHGLERDPGSVDRLTRQYAIAALRHRISLHGMTMEPPPFKSSGGGGLELDFRSWDAEVGPLLDGEVLPNGARFTSIDVRAHPKAKSDEQRVAYWRAYARHLREKGWLDRAFIYSRDEPKPEQLPEVRKIAELAHKADRGLNVLVTASKAPPIDDVIDIFAPNINCMFNRPGDEYCHGAVALASYRGERKAGARLWWYQSCGSHGCGPLPALDATQQAYFTGWPSYMVDHDGALNRAMGVLAFEHGIEGELYFNTVQAWNPDDGGARADPWKSVWRFHGNGDGTFFYPGTPERIGGKTHVPVESLRLKHVRDGLEDYEYLVLAQKLGLKKEAQAAARALAPKPWEIVRDPAAWARIRDGLGDSLDKALAGRPEYPRKKPVEAKKAR